MLPMLFAPRKRRSASAAATGITSSARRLTPDNDELLGRGPALPGDGVAQREHVAVVALPRKQPRVVVEDGRGARRVAADQAEAHAVVDAGKEVRLPAGGAGVKQVGAAEVAALLCDAAEEVIAEAELRRRHVRYRAQRGFGDGIVFVILAEADEHARLRRRLLAHPQHLDRKSTR